MDSFEIQIGPEQRRIRVERLNGNTYKLLAVDPNSELAGKDSIEIEDIPVSNELGQITVRDEKDFDFEGAGAFSGDELLGVAAQITLHPSFAKSENSGSL